MLQWLCQAGADDVGDLPVMQEVHHRIVKEATVCAQQTHRLVAQMAKRGCQKFQYVVGATGVARAQPEVGHHAALCNERQQGVMRMRPRLLGL